MQQNDRVKAEKAILVGLSADCFRPEENATDESLDELEALLETAGGICEAKVLQNRHTPDPHSFIGEGKAQEVRTLLESTGATLVVFDNDLSPSQIRALEELTDAIVLDRSALILDIFAQRAKTAEGRLQVELAQYQYLLPKLSGMGTSMSRLGGGIGTRGPGEKKIEVDRRRIRRRIFELTQDIEKVKQQRDLRRSARRENEVKEVALVGYTNAGKSSLLNALTDAGVLAEDKLFATLDPVTRKVMLPDVGETVFTDTVGFIEKLPHDLVSAFRSTLEEVTHADLLLCVTDAANPNAQKQMDVVDGLLESLGAAEKPKITVMNKADLLAVVPPDEADTIYISTRSGYGMEALLAKAAEKLAPQMMSYEGRIGYDKGDLLALVNRHGKEIELEYLPEGIEIKAKLPVETIKKLKS